jgi:hypothetical protein
VLCDTAKWRATRYRRLHKGVVGAPDFDFNSKPNVRKGSKALIRRRAAIRSTLPTVLEA